MPRLHNLRRIKDTATGRYLYAVGHTLRSWYQRPHFFEPYYKRRNAWNGLGTMYKESQVTQKLKEASLCLAWSTWYTAGNTAPERPEGARYNSPEMRAWQEERDRIASEVEASAVIPDTWVVETIYAEPTAVGQPTPAKDWKPA